MSASDLNAPVARSWRDIPQQVKPRAMSGDGRRRLVFKIAKFAAISSVLGLLVWGGANLVLIFRAGPQHMPVQADAVPVRDIVLTTDGAVGHAWVVQTLALPRKATLMELDLFQLRERLLASGQVRAASLTRSFPATLMVTLNERQPVVRVAAPGGGATLVVARDGVVFSAVGYAAADVAALPLLDGVKLEPQGGRFAPIAGMDYVADLLVKARMEAEHLYRTWRTVSLAGLAHDGELAVQTEDGLKVVFGTRESFFPQLARLDLLLDTARAQSPSPPREINLAIGAHVPVAFQALAAAPAKPARGRAEPKTPPAPIIINLQLNPKL